MLKSVTKKMVLEAIKGAAEAGAEFGETVSAEDVIAYVDTAIAQLDSKAAKAKERAAKNRAEDPLREIVKETLTDEPKTIAAIVSEINNPEVTNSKVVSRLTQLCKLGEANKTDVKIDNRKIKAYFITSEVTNK